VSHTVTDAGDDDLPRVILWPDLFCDSCNQEPEWSHEEAVARIKLL
jgi:hypothetical protein